MAKNNVNDAAGRKAVRSSAIRQLSACFPRLPMRVIEHGVDSVFDKLFKQVVASSNYPRYNDSDVRKAFVGVIDDLTMVLANCNGH